MRRSLSIFSLTLCLLAYSGHGAPTTTTTGQGGTAKPHHQLPHEASTTLVPLKIKLPFPAGSTYEVIQGNHDTYTHTGFNTYAWDFALPEHTAVCAAAAGRVVCVKQDGTSGGPSSEFFHDGNTIILDHGNGYYTQYLHLAHGGARVREGELVKGGQIIALSGNTGFSNTPHLHFQVQDATGQSLPAKFEDLPPPGIPKAGTHVTSRNDGRGTSPYAGESVLPVTIFQGNSITLLTQTLPGHIFRRSRTYTVHGRITGKKPKRVVLYIMAPDGGKPLQSVFADVSLDGFFTAEFQPNPPAAPWSDDRTQSNLYSLALAPVKEDGSYWSKVSIPICVR